jgi:hypothetical protein
MSLTASRVLALRLAGAGALALALLATAGCTAAPTTSVPIVPFDEREATEFHLGDCFSIADFDAIDIEPDERLRCDEPHNTEIVGLLEDFDGVPFTGTEALDDAVFPQCFDAIREGVTEALDELPLVTSYTGRLADDSDNIEGPILCLMFTRNGDILTDSTFVADPHDVIGDYVYLHRLEPGSCFTLGEQGNLALPADCESGTLMFLGVIASPSEGGEWPGVDELRLERNEGCADLIPEDDDSIDPATLSGTIPQLGDWLRGATDITCDVEVI